VQDLHLRWLTLALGGLALAFLAAGLTTRSAAALGWGLAVLGGEYAVLFAAQGRALDEAAPVYAVGFVLVAELAFWSVERRVAAWSEPTLTERRLALLVGVCVGAAAVAALVLVLAAASGGGGIALEAVGVAAAIGALALLGALVRRTAASQQRTPLR
jgi:hypothetical protein